MDDLYSAYGLQEMADASRSRSTRQPVVFVGINLDEGKAVDEGSPTSLPPASISILDGGWFGPNSLAYHVYRRGVPWHVAIDPDGNLLAWGHSVTDLWEAIGLPPT